MSGRMKHLFAQQISQKDSYAKILIFTRAIKHNITVALDKEIYLKKIMCLVMNMFSHESIYLVLNKNPIRKMINSLHELLVR